MKIDILTLFPNMFQGFLNESIIKRAIEKQKVAINIINFRDFSHLPNQQVDDTPYGGGRGMVLRCEPIIEALESIKTKESKVILLCPQGTPFKEQKALKLSKEKHLILICGHYEGYDERIRNFVDEEISIGDYILTGGELPAMVISDAIIRLIPGVITKDSFLNDSFMNQMLDYPTYTKPPVYKGLKVPDVLLSGHHENIKKWREEQALANTLKRRKDLLEKKENKDD